MRTADIVVGGEYAIGSPNATYEKWRRCRAKVIATGQTGISQGDWRTYSCSEKRFVELEIVEDPQAGSGGMFRWHFTVDVKTGNFSEYDKHTLERVYRVPSQMVLKPWHVYAKELAEHTTREEENQARLERERDERSDLIFRLTELGFDGVMTHGRSIHFSVDNAERVCQLVTALKGAVGDNAFNALFKETRDNG